MSVFNTISNFALDIFFPRTCVGCGSDGQFLCQPCQDSIIIVPQKLTLNGITKTIVATDYHQAQIESAIKQFKYHNLPQLAKPLSDLLIKTLELESPFPIYYLLAVPLHRKRLRQRGYNQSDLLAKNIANHFHWPLLTGLSRIVDTKHQAGLSRAERLINTQEAFLYHGPTLAGKNILLIDDVVTTGATLESIARSLKNSMPNSIVGLAIARNREDDNS